MSAVVTLIEVSPRDGFQSVVPIIPVPDKVAMIRALAEAGLKHIEVGAFVHPKAIPQMADIQQLLAELRTERDCCDSFESIVLVPNQRGAVLAAQQQCQRLNFVFSVSEAHNLKNVGKTIAESLQELRAVQQVITQHPKMQLRVSLATSFDCPFAGPIDQQRALEVLAQVTVICPNAQIAMCDTTGKAHPFKVERLFSEAFIQLENPRQVIFHCHDTYGMAIANVAAAYRAGVRFFDTAVAGFGGCPFAPGASGNVATEDVVYFFESAGIDTGIDSDKLRCAIFLAQQIEGAQLGGSIRLLNREL
ncbi:MAG: hydroxymethylglutaryl-CoA lyase [Pseudomonadales bacterium]|nr:hydroxymethylglutaryl-CoA lyase [Pseudomonadales bacterium]NRA18800.1 hydroxymethylglutaryl-CoA lyase [Oceanospirillaceae bacterium]